MESILESDFVWQEVSEVYMWTVHFMSCNSHFRHFDSFLHGVTKVTWFPVVFTFAVGILCSLLGIGGGELMGPLMLQMGLLPQVSHQTPRIRKLISILTGCFGDHISAELFCCFFFSTLVRH